MRSPARNVVIKTIKGRQYYVGRFTMNGKRLDRSLGAVGSITLQQARVALGVIIEELESKSPVETDDRPTFADILPEALETIAAVKKWKNDASRRQWEQTMRDYAVPVIGDKAVADITVDHVFEVLRPLWVKRPETATRVRMRLEAVLNWATVKGLRTGANPALWRGNLQMLLPARNKKATVKHMEAPTIDELRSIVLYCVKHPSPVSGLLLVVAGSACRVTEARMMMAQEIRDGIWTIPGDRMKNSMPHRVPVTEMIRAGLAMGNQKGERLVFSASPSGEAPLSLDSPRLKIVKIIKREGDGSWDPINLPRLVCHDRRARRRGREVLVAHLGRCDRAGLFPDRPARSAARGYAALGRDSDAGALGALIRRFAARSMNCSLSCCMICSAAWMLFR